MKKEFTNLKDFIEDVSFNRWIVEKSDEDRLIWEAWLANNPEKKALLENAASILTGIQFNVTFPSPAKIEKELNSLHLSIAAKEAADKQPKQMLGGLRRSRIWSIAAAIALLLAVTFAMPYFLQETIIEHTTAFAEFKKIQLPDNSKVILNANSTLKYAANTPRKVWLTGEAFFEVTKKPETGENFLVQTDDLTVEVLGTSFNVKHRNEETKVFLEEGKIVLAVEQMEQQPIEMSPGELVSYSKNQQKEITKIKAKAIDNTSLKNGVLRFNEATLKEALEEISLIYGIQFKISTNYVNEELFEGGVPVDNEAIMLKALETVYGIKIKKEGAVYLISQ